MRNRSFYFFHKEKFYIYREDISEEKSIIIRIEILEKFKRAKCIITAFERIGAISGIETFSMGASTKMFKWQILDAIEDNIKNKRNIIDEKEGDFEEIKEFIRSNISEEKVEVMNDVIEIIDDNAHEMELIEKKKFSLFGRK
ncbi:hypothetical protein [Clostridium sp.]|uniref:hypothetical protein n=1 Tax=Clostridium sp. TaxID=1506 RepID=UPI003992A6C9